MTANKVWATDLKQGTLIATRLRGIADRRVPVVDWNGSGQSAIDTQESQEDHNDA